MTNLYKEGMPQQDMAKEDVFNPWEVSGDIDYERLLKEFGITRMKDLPDVFKNELLFRRGIIFAHRDFPRILDAVKQKKPFGMITGLMPTGKFHIGHLMVAQQMVFYQKLGAKVYIAVADIEAYNARGQDLATSRTNAVEDYILNYLALGLNPEQCEIYFQSDRSKDAKKANAYYRLQNLLARHITFNEFKSAYGEVTPGKMLSALLQASDILHMQLPEFEGPLPLVVPVGIDQDPHLRITRDLAQRIKNPKFVQVSSTYHFFAPGLKGGKMSSSDSDSFISPTDSAKEVERKIKKYAFSGGKDTLEEHRKLGGNPDIDVSFQYLRFLFEPYDKKLAKIEADYRSGKLLSGELKAYTIEKINAFLKEHQARREKARKDVEKFVYKEIS